jgi:hypothetical protein
MISGNDEIESTPDTSFVSVDENGLMNEHDEFGVGDHNWLDEDNEMVKGSLCS